MRERGVVESERRKREREREECKQQLEMFCEQFTSFIFAFPLSPSLLLLVLCVGVVLIVIYVFPSLLHIYSFIAQWHKCVQKQLCAAHCATRLSSSRCSSLLLLLLLCTHSSSRANYIIRHFYFYSDFKREREGERERGTEQVQS